MRAARLVVRMGVEPKRLGRRLEGVDVEDAHEHVRMDRSVSIPAVLDQRINTIDYVRSPGQVVACLAFDYRDNLNAKDDKEDRSVHSQCRDCRHDFAFPVSVQEWRPPSLCQSPS